MKQQQQQQQQRRRRRRLDGAPASNRLEESLAPANHRHEKVACSGCNGVRACVCGGGGGSVLGVWNGLLRASTSSACTLRMNALILMRDRASHGSGDMSSSGSGALEGAGLGYMSSALESLSSSTSTIFTLVGVT